MFIPQTGANTPPPTQWSKQLEFFPSQFCVWLKEPSSSTSHAQALDWEVLCLNVKDKLMLPNKINNFNFWGLYFPLPNEQESQIYLRELLEIVSSNCLAHSRCSMNLSDPSTLSHFQIGTCCVNLHDMCYLQFSISKKIIISTDTLDSVQKCQNITLESTYYWLSLPYLFGHVCWP